MKRLIGLGIFCLSMSLQCQDPQSTKALDCPITKIQENYRLSQEDIEDKKEQDQLNATMQAVLQGFATIAGGVITIMQNPHDRDRVGAQVNNMLTSLVNIGIHASKSQSKESQDYLKNLSDFVIPYMLKIIQNHKQDMQNHII